MSVIRDVVQRGWPVLLAGVAAIPLAGGAVWGVVPPTAGFEDGLVRVQLKQRFSGVFHEDRLIPQSTVLEINEFNGVVWDDRGHVVSFIGSTWAAFAGVRPGASLVLPDGTETAAELVGIDERISLAVLRAPQVVERRMATGNPDAGRNAGLLFWAGSGWGSRPLRMLRSASGDTEAEREIRVHLSDAGLKPPSDGGILLDSAGRFLGFVTQLERGGVVPAAHSLRLIPVQAVTESVQEVLGREGNVRAGWLGVLMDGGIPRVRIREVVEGSPAARSGLRAGDLVLRVGEADVSSHRQFVKLIRWRGPGGRVELTVERDGNLRRFAPVLTESPIGDRQALAWAVEIPRLWRSAGGAPEPQVIQLYRAPIGSFGNLGLAVDPLTPQLARYFQSPSGGGLLVKTVLEGTPAGKLGIQAGDVLLSMNDLELRSAADIRRVVHSSRDGVLSITFLRGGELHTRRVVLH